MKTASICVTKFATKNQLRALVEKGLVKLGNFRKNQNKRKDAYLLTPAGLEEKTHITRAFLKRKEAEYEAIRREIEALRSGAGILGATRQPDAQTQSPSLSTAP